jgi:hypothetical protein
MDSKYLFSQIFALLACAFVFASFQFKERRKILFCFVGSGSLLGIHYLLLDNYMGALLMGIAVSRFIIFAFYRGRFLLGFYLLVPCVVLYFTYTSLVNLLSFAGNMLMTFGSFVQDDRRLRQLMMAGIFCWTLHDIVIKSPAAIFLDICFFSSNILGYVRYYYIMKK